MPLITRGFKFEAKKSLFLYCLSRETINSAKLYKKSFYF